MSVIDYLADTNAIIYLLDGNSLRMRWSTLYPSIYKMGTIQNMVLFLILVGRYCGC